MTVQRALSLLLAATLLPMLAGGAWILHSQWSGEREAANARLLSQAYTLVAATDQELAAVVGRLQSAAASEQIDRADWPGFHRYARRALADWPGALMAVTAANGQLVVNSGVELGTPLPNLWGIEARHGETEWRGHRLPLSSQGVTRRVFETGRPQYSNLYIAVSLHRPTLAVAVLAGTPVAAPAVEGAAAAPVGRHFAVTMSFPPTALQQVLERTARDPGLRSYIVDRNGIIVATNGHTASQVGDRAREWAAPAGAADDKALPGHGFFDMPSRDGTAMVGAWVRSQTTGFRVIAALPREQAYAAAQRALSAWGLMIGGVALLGGVLSVALAARLRGGLQNLARLAQQPDEGASRDGNGSDSGWHSVLEIDRAAEALRAARLAQAGHQQAQLERRLAEEQRAAIVASEDRLRRIVDNLFVFVGLLDAQGRVIEVNEAPLKAAALTRNQIIGQQLHHCPWWTHDPHVVERVRLNVCRALRGETVRYDETIRVAHAGRAVIDFQLAPLRDATGAITSVVASGVNITARLQAVAEAESQRARLDALLDAAPAGIAMCDAGGRLLRTNRVFLDIWGRIPERTDTIADFAAWRGWWADGSARRGQPLGPEDWPMAQALRTGQAQIGEVIEILPFDTLGLAPAGRRVLHLSASPVVDAGGAVTGGVAVLVDITERVAIERVLREADRQKDEFIATLAHELRNPLAPIRACAEIIRLRRPADVEVARCGDIVLRQSEHLERLLDDLLDASRVRLGTVVLQRTQLDLRDVVDAAVESLQPVLQRSAHQLQIDLPAQPLTVEGDATRLAQVVCNLLNNACKFTRAPGHLQLRLAIQDDDAVLTVTDDGCGIAPENLERVFELFTQERPSGEAGLSGLGIGLALARRLVALHGGHIHAHSAGVGSGSTFVVRLPLAVSAADTADLFDPLTEADAQQPAVRAAEHAPARGPERRHEHGSARERLPLDAAASRAAAAAAAEAGPGGQPLRVLVVDDNQDAAQSLAQLLQLLGHDVGTASSGQDALDCWQRDAPDLLVLDIGLPDMSGHELARRIRAAQNPSAPPMLVALTGWGQAADRQRAEQAGFDHHLTKPADPALLLRLLETVRARQVPQRPAT